jgi:calcium-dependent protein kinase
LDRDEPVNLTENIGTPLYKAPEVNLGTGYDQRCDIWSLGIMLYKMLTGTFPYQGDSE